MLKNARHYLYLAVGFLLSSLITSVEATGEPIRDELFDKLRHQCELNKYSCEALANRTDCPISRLAATSIVEVLRRANTQLEHSITLRNNMLRGEAKNSQDTRPNQFSIARAQREQISYAIEELQNLGLAEISADTTLPGKLSLDQQLHYIEGRIKALEDGAPPAYLTNRDKWNEVVEEFRQSRELFTQAVELRQALTAIIDDMVNLQAKLPINIIRELKSSQEGGDSDAIDALARRFYADADKTIQRYLNRPKTSLNERSSERIPKLSKDTLSLVKRVSMVLTYGFDTKRVDGQYIHVRVTLAFLKSGPVLSMRTKSAAFNEELRQMRSKMLETLSIRIRHQDIEDYSHGGDPMIDDIKKSFNVTYSQMFPEKSEKFFLEHHRSAAYYIPL